MSKAASKLKFILFLGSVRDGRIAPRVGKFIQQQLGSKYDFTLFDPLKLDLPLVKKPFHFYTDPTKAPKLLQDCNEKLKMADAFIVVTAEYYRSISPALSNMLDHFGPSVFSYKPSGIVCYSPGPYGGMQAAMQLRCFLSELGTLNVSNIFGIPEIHKAIDEDGKPLNDYMVKGLDTMVAQLDWYAHAMKNHRDKFGLPK